MILNDILSPTKEKKILLFMVKNNFHNQGKISVKVNGVSVDPLRFIATVKKEIVE